MCLTRVRQTPRLPHLSGGNLDPPPRLTAPLHASSHSSRVQQKVGLIQDHPQAVPNLESEQRQCQTKREAGGTPQLGVPGVGGREEGRGLRPPSPPCLMPAHRGVGAAGAVSRTGRPWPLTSCLACVPAALRKAGGGNRATEVFLGRSHGSGGHGAGRTRSSPFYFRGNGPKIGSTWNSSF